MKISACVYCVVLHSIILSPTVNQHFHNPIKTCLVCSDGVLWPWRHVASLGTATEWKNKALNQSFLPEERLLVMQDMEDGRFIG